MSIDDDGTSWYGNAIVNGGIGAIYLEAVDVAFLAEDGRRWLGLAVIGTSLSGPYGGPTSTSIRFKGAGSLVEAAERAPWEG